MCLDTHHMQERLVNHLKQANEVCRLAQERHELVAALMQRFPEIGDLTHKETLKFIRELP